MVPPSLSRFAMLCKMSQSYGLPSTSLTLFRRLFCALLNFLHSCLSRKPTRSILSFFRPADGPSTQSGVPAGIAASSLLGVPTALTNASGKYLLANLPLQDSYKVLQQLPAHIVQHPLLGFPLQRQCQERSIFSHNRTNKRQRPYRFTTVARFHLWLQLLKDTERICKCKLFLVLRLQQEIVNVLHSESSGGTERIPPFIRQYPK